MQVAAIDFGTHSSGVVWGSNDDEIINDFHYNNKALNGGYAKTRTAFLVLKSLLENIDSLSDNEIRPSDHEDLNENTNVWIGDISREKYLDAKRSQDDTNWVYFDRFKMCLYNRDSVVIGSDKKEYNLEKIITLFLRCLKISFLRSRISECNRDSLKWGVTIPTIWDEYEKTIMKTAAIKALNKEPIFILEPEGAAISFSLQQHGNIDPAYIQRDECFLVIDCGGGTTDIVAQKLIVENQQAKYEELTSAKGRAKAGGDIDDKFWELLAEKLATKGTCFGTPLVEYVESFRVNNVAGWHQMEKEWLSRKHNPASSDKIRFEFPRSYSIWLKENHQDAFNAFDDEFGCTIIFSRQEIEEKVFKPVVDEIIAAAQESAQSAPKLDYIFLAGGLSGLAYLQNAVKESFAKSHPGAQVLFEHYSDHAAALPGGSIMRGAAVILVFDKLVRRVSKRNYYYTTFSSSYDEETMQYNIEQAGGQWTGTQRTAFQAEKNRISPICEKCSSGETRTHVFVPICCKNAPASLFKSGSLSPLHKEQTEVKFKFFSSDRDVFLYRENDPHIRKEGEITLPCSYDSKFEIEIDFNEFQQANLYANITNKNTSECRKVALKLEVQVGH